MSDEHVEFRGDQGEEVSVVIKREGGRSNGSQNIIPKPSLKLEVYYLIVDLISFG